MADRVRRAGGRQVELVIESLGGRGDGVGQFQGRSVFVPQALPGERLRVRLGGKRAGGLWGEPLELLVPAADRRDPPCPHFGPCGGCALQHWEEGAYRRWKRGLVVETLSRRGLPGERIGELVSIAPGTRRRASLSAVRLARGVRLGFHEQRSRRVADIEGCLILTPSLTALLPTLQAGLAPVLETGENMGVMVTETEGGPDVLLQARRDPTRLQREALSRLAETAALARLSWTVPGGEPEPLALRRPATVTLAGVPVELPPGGFLQPSREGEAALVELVLRGLPPAGGPILELFAGCGSFTFALAKQARVRAVEGDAAALGALSRAAAGAGLAGRVETEHRDLARRPLLAAEMAEFDTLVFDPPRDGAKEQVSEIARSGVPKVVAVSCNPRSFARDARILSDGGYALEVVTPVDQFLWSAHVELVATFTR